MNNKELYHLVIDLVLV